ncbi:methanol/ethanol family PQQ-dependent dehydrogenase [Beijerinckia indica]|uniref:PQQ-dependent dehydrogenase, methanol/ethanol family n=1 Tax=Beijerinckia indica subsp. indica (strain ATCC 9039 / DSM 1715 / NCIMB 8712) TaxID=395963 RepID=B2IGB9_BEII9|nr:methanol/ethanol family PQQ-dependent dehydrogenase [Beijerinckia indica]ACB97191.1 PQQ-dependent dehydrogenase, methanol/ethanol family [Beijerinckia indica subsp. indica ATCC 9039]
MKRSNFLRSTSLAVALMLTGGAIAAEETYAPVTDARLGAAAKDAGWLMYRRDYTGSGYAPFDTINTSNVANLKQVWDYKTDFDMGHESPAIVNGDYLFITTPKNELHAFQASTGKPLWVYKHDLTGVGLKTICCDVVNRGVALYGDNVYMATLDNRVVALDAKTGKPVWNTQLEKPDVGYAMTVAPLALKGKVVVGVSGGEYGARGYIAALDASTGKEVWRRHTIPAPNEPGGDTWPEGAYKTGGGPAWLTGSYDADTDTLFWGVGNPGPWLATLRPGDNLYTDSVLALDPATGNIKWHYQYTPNDTWDYDGTNEQVLIDITHEGKPYKALVSASRNGWLYAIDRTNGKLIYGEKFATATSVTGFKDGKPVTDPDKRPDINKEIFTCPSFLGGKNWWPISVDVKTQIAYVPTMHTCMTMKGNAVSYRAGLPFLGESFKVVRDPAFPNHWGAVQAIDLNTGKQVWDFPSELPWNDGTLTTAGGVVFSGSADGYLHAFDAKTGKVLWKSPQATSGFLGVPSTWKVGDKQYIGIYAGWGGGTPIWGGDMAKDPRVLNIPLGGHFYVFSL